MAKKKQNLLTYKCAQILSSVVAKVVFRRKYLRNEIKDVKGPMVIIGNHEAALDFTTLIGATKEPMTFVVSDSFYNTLPFKKSMKEIGVISKQQFQTSVKDIVLMRNTLKNDGILTFYPAGLMSENGLSTPIPAATYDFLQWLNVDVYAARIIGSYFCTPKWSGKVRPGRTYLDIYKIIKKEDLPNMTHDQIKEAVESALLFDSYREQEKHKIKYIGCSNIKGLENVLYMCPNCEQEFTIHTKNKNTIYCEKCGFEHKSDKYGFLHNCNETGDEFRYVSDWSSYIYDKTKSEIESGELTELSSRAVIQTIDYKKCKYVRSGYANVTLTPQKFIIEGAINCKREKLEIPITSFASLPFKPGCRIEIQHNDTTYRCVLEDAHLAMKFVNMVKAFYEINNKQNKQ